MDRGSIGMWLVGVRWAIGTGGGGVIHILRPAAPHVQPVAQEREKGDRQHRDKNEAALTASVNSLRLPFSNSGRGGVVLVYRG